jgi:hypothetical protein
MSFPQALRKILARIEGGTNGYLEAKGWFATRASMKAADSAGMPCPWFTYPAIAFLEERTTPEWVVLEYGSGAGTEWWSARCSRVYAVEHDAAWGDSVGSRTRASVLMAVSGAEDEYVRRADDFAPFDIIVVDGVYRPACLGHAPSMLSSGGVIILDDAQRAEYVTARQQLKLRGFKSIDFWGPQPVSKHEGCTTVFYRADNVLLI